ncbi:MAG: phosphatase PAP2 family protein [Planctomycetaceae bacterium]|nr:phosphatase PAP2 family protein [Planctomycetaceae bacterium]
MSRTFTAVLSLVVMLMTWGDACAWGQVATTTAPPYAATPARGYAQPTVYALPSAPAQVIPPAPQQPAFNDIDDRVLIQRMDPAVGLAPPSPPPGFNPPPVELLNGTPQPTYPPLAPLDGGRHFEEPPVIGGPTPTSGRATMFERLLADQRNYYSWRTAGMYAGAFGLGAVMANTSIDQHFQNWYQREIGNSGFIHSFKYAGEGVIILPTYFVAMGVGYLFDEQPAGSWIGEWGRRSFRAALVGAPPMLLAQFITGGSRPGERDYNSAWHPFQDVNSVSGHSFMGAIPFLTAAQMVDRPVPKFALYGLSTMTGWSRVNDNAHYLSQIMLGWTMAVAATFAVDDTQRTLGFDVIPMVGNGNQGLIFEWRR